jgi:hypothetical protein
MTSAHGEYYLSDFVAMPFSVFIYYLHVVLWYIVFDYECLMSPTMLFQIYIVSIWFIEGENIS